MTGLPPLSIPPERRREVELWLKAAVSRVEREATVGCQDASEGRGMKKGAERVAELMLSAITAHEATT